MITARLIELTEARRLYDTNVVGRSITANCNRYLVGGTRGDAQQYLEREQTNGSYPVYLRGGQVYHNLQGPWFARHLQELMWLKEERMPLTVEIASNTTYNGVNFSDASITLQSVVATGFNNCNFSGVDLTGTIFKDCDFQGCDFTQARLDHLLFRSTNFIHNTFTQAHWFYTRLLDCTVVDTTLEQAEFDNCFFERVQFNTVTVKGCRFSGCIMTHTTFATQSSLTYVSVCGPHGMWDHVTFQETSIRSVEFTDTVMRNVQIENKSSTKSVTIGPGCHIENCAFETVRTRKCKGCGNSTKLTDFYKADICRVCAQSKQYSQKNTKMVGKTTKYPAFSMEVEVEGVEVESDPDPVLLVKYGFLVCSDTSVQSEYKSPIYLDRKSFYHVLPVLESIKQHIGDRCGTHVHVQMVNKRRLYEHYNEIIGPLQEWCIEHAAETNRFWGRYFTSYAMAPGFPSVRYSWINTYVSGQPTIEFRLCKFTSQKQFMTMLTFCRSMVRYLDVQLEILHSRQEYAEMGQVVLRLYKHAIKDAKED